MTIKEAWEKWRSLNQNTVLANNSRYAVGSILLKKYGSSNILMVNQRKAYEIFTNEYTREMNVKAASILWQLIESNLNIFVNNPFKSYDELLPPETEPAAPNRKPTRAQIIGKKGGRPGEKVCKIDPTTLEVVDTYDSIAEAQRQNDGVFLDRALSKGYKANGFYWSRKPLVDSFIEQLKLKSFGLKPKKADPEERKKQSDQIKAEREAVVKAGRKAFNNAINETVARVLEKATDEELLAELQRRGWHGPIQLTKKIVL